MTNLAKPISSPSRLSPVLGPDNLTFDQYWYQYILDLIAKLNASFIGVVGSVKLVAGVATVPLKGLTTDDIALVTLAKGVGTLGVQYQGDCNTNNLVITSLNADLSIAAGDTSTVNYAVHNVT